ncbi:MAG: hypothetical protein K8T20_03170 [Planctomycetes bacterium]|nr:hypothetical protein [Planctomycetota bacterium]
MKFRRLSPLVALAFFAAQVASSVCAASMAQVAEAGKKPVRSCCAKHDEHEPKSPAPARDECCCSDGGHVAVLDEPALQVPLPEIDAPAVVEVLHAGLTVVPAPFEGPPGRGPDIPLFTLHRTLLI